MSFDLIIWDCNGCLVDSEVIVAEAEARLVTSLGYPISAETYFERYAGVKMRAIFEELEREQGIELFGRFDKDAYEKEVRDLLAERLEKTPYVDLALNALNLPMCVASDSVPRKLEHELRITGLWDRFGGKVFSSELVPNSKPAPDVFLHAARQMGARPRRCLVIEDSCAGVTAGKAAKMTVFAFALEERIKPQGIEKLKAARPDRMFGDMRELPRLVAEWSPV